ncbi:MAG TPA: hypothetical protein VD970_06600, partial [Acetobacteraceae bacterium]|nr:hypothetical protein [Acetobacteraceae bacterium]
MEHRNRDHLRQYLAIVEDFLAGTITTEELQQLYQGTMQRDPTPLDDMEYEILNEFFLDIEDYV